MTTANPTTSTNGSESCNAMTVVFTLPAHWASYLINNDSSSFFCLEENGPQATVDLIDSWIQRESLGACLGCSDESFFTWHPDFPPNEGGTCLDYTFILNA